MVRGRASKRKGPHSRHINALCDALIQNHPILLPSEVGQLWEMRFQTLALIFAAHAPEASHVLPLSIAEEDKGMDDYWISACKLLLKVKPEKLAPACLQKIRVECQITLQVEGEARGGGGGRFGLRCADGIIRHDEGWPPTVRYEIALKGAAGDILLAEGPSNAFYRRTVYPRDAGCGSIGTAPIFAMGPMQGVSMPPSAPL